MSSRQLIKGTLILTIAGIITRLIGFVYKIFLSNKIGAVNLGIYQLVFPVYSICHTIYASGIQTSLSKNIAALSPSTPSRRLQLLYHSVVLSVIPAFILSVIVYAASPYIANRLLFEPECTRYLKMITFVFPFCAVTSCINGYYYGLKGAKIPAISQMVEQLFRTAIVFAITLTSIVDYTDGCIIAVIGLVAGELASCIYTCLTLKNPENTKFSPSRKVLGLLLVPAVYLTLNRLLINVLSAIETTLIPFMLRRFGMSASDSLYIYGTIFGMSLPFIMFPSTIASAFAVMLLPEISQDYANGNNSKIISTTRAVVTISGVIGVIAAVIFTLFGRSFGILIFDSVDSGIYMQALAVLSPFIYISTSFTSILNGLDKTLAMLINSICGLGIRICTLIFLVPEYGIWSYIVGLIFSQIILTILNLITIKKVIMVHIDWYHALIFPLVLSLFIMLPLKKLYDLFTTRLVLNKPYSIIILGILLLTGCLTYIASIIYNKNYKFLRIAKRNL